MRGAFVETLVELAAVDERILLLTGDLGFMALEPFSDRFGDRFFNVGVAEQNMIGIATGLAESGFIPFVYSIATFASLRGYEFIRNGPIAHRLPVRIVGVGGGFEYGPAGPTHHGLEDVGVMRAQPGITVIAPADHEQTRTALRATWDIEGPVYYRIGKDDRRVVPGLSGRFTLGSFDLVRDGSDLVLVTMGSLAATVLAAAEALAEDGVSAAVIVVSSLDGETHPQLAQALSRFDRAMSVESHFVNGGLGSLVAETIAEGGMATTLTRCGVSEGTTGRSGSAAYYLERHRLDRDAIVDRVRNPA